MLLLDADWRIAAVSGDVPALLGLEAAALVGQPLLDLHPPDLRGRVEALLRAPGDSPAARAVTVALPQRTLVLKIEPLSGAGQIALVLQDPAELEVPAAAEVPAARVLRIPVDAAEGVDLIDPARALYIRAAGHYSQVRMADGERFCSLPLKEVEARLDGQGFTRVHRGYLVNLSHVRTLRRTAAGTVLELDALPPLTVPVGRSQIPRLRRLLSL